MAIVRTKSGRILIAEDTEETAFFMREILEHQGYEVESAMDGAASLERARQTLPDLLLLDIMMPRMHGIGVLKALKADPATRGIGIVICTGKDFPSEHEEWMRLGAAGVLVKPFEAPQLVGMVRSFFEARAAGGTLEHLQVAPSENRQEVYAPVLDSGRSAFRLWGTRGSIPTPGARYLRHGGNTSCLSVSAGGEVFIFDAGSGIRELGIELMKGPIRRLHLFITHTHWDHIQGLPFFPPAYVPGFEINIYGAEGFGKNLPSLLGGQLDRDYFPVQMEHMGATMKFHNLAEGAMRIGPAKISWEFAHHPGATVGYRIEIDGTSIAWVPDNEFLQGYFGDPREIDRGHAVAGPFDAFIRFLEGSDLVIHEAQYTNAEYLEKVRWGHSSISNAALLMRLADIPRWLVTHHDPSHDDDFLETKRNLTRQILDHLGHPARVDNAYDGLTEYFGSDR